MSRVATIQDTSLYPAIYAAKGLLQAHFDCLGGSPEEYNTRGTLDGAVFNVDALNRVIIPEAKGGGRVSWMRGVWLTDVTFRYDGFMSDLNPLQTLPAAKNYLGSGQPDLNNWQYGSSAKVSTTVVSGVVTAITLVDQGTKYQVGNLVPINGGNNDARFTVTGVDSGGAITSFGSLVGGSGYVASTLATCKPAVNLVGQTVITLPQPISEGTPVQAYYDRRDGTLIEKGAALSGYPNRRSSMRENDYGTANDGDLYCANSFYYAYAATGTVQYKMMADRLMDAQVSRSFGLGQVIPFDVPLDAVQGSAGLYYYNGGGSPWTWDVEDIPGFNGLQGLRVQTTVLSDGPPYGFAGWGTWPAWPVTPISPFNSYSFDFYGNGLGGGIQLSTNIYQPATPDGEFVFGFSNLPADAGIKRTYVADKGDFWNVVNVLYNQDRSSTYKGASSSDDSCQLNVVVADNFAPNGTKQFYRAELVGSLTAAFASYFFGSNNLGFNSAGTTSISVDVTTDRATAIYYTITDANDNQFETIIYHLTPINQTVTIPYSSLTPASGIVHPIKQLGIQPAIPATNLFINNIICGSLRTLANVPAPIELLGGFQFAFGVGVFDCYWKNCQINQTATDPYPGISRYTYGYVKSGGAYGRGSWQGQIAVGYMWLLGYTLSDVRFPAGSIARYLDGTSFDYSGLPVAYCVRKFMEDSQLEFANQYPSKPVGPMIANYGAWAWEFVEGIGNIGGEIVPNPTYPLGVLNQFYFAKDGSIGSGGEVDPRADGSWPGYMTRAIVSVAEDYFVSGDKTSKGVLEKWVALIAANATWDAGTKEVTLPVNIFGDGSAMPSGSLYSLNCVGEALLYKLWVDNDATAQLWLPRIIECLHTNYKITELGKLYGVFPTKGGSGYSYATATVVDSTGTGAVVVPFLAGGEITHYDIISEGSGYVNPTVIITGDGTGAVGNPYLSDLLFGGYDRQHTGWEIAEMGKFLGLLLRPASELGTINFSYTVPATVSDDYDDLRTFYANNTGWQRPSICNGELYPLHEYTWSSFHWNASIEDPVSFNGTQGGSRDTHSDGDSWTESIGPSIWYAVDVQKATKDNTWLQAMYGLCQHMQDAVPEPIVPGISLLSELYNGSNVDANTASYIVADLGTLGSKFPNVPINLGVLT